MNISVIASVASSHAVSGKPSAGSRSARRAGLKPDDVITRCAGWPVNALGKVQRRLVRGVDDSGWSDLETAEVERLRKQVKELNQQVRQLAPVDTPLSGRMREQAPQRVQRVDQLTPPLDHGGLEVAPPAVVAAPRGEFGGGPG